MDVYLPADSFVNGSTSVERLWFRLECSAWVRQTRFSLILLQRSVVRTIFDSSWELVCCLISNFQARCLQDKWTFQQDFVPANTVRNTTYYLKKEKIGLIEPNSPDLNSVDYAVWRALQQTVYHRRKFNTVEELKWAITTVWKKLSQHFIDNSVNEWRFRLECVVRNNGGHIKQCNFA